MNATATQSPPERKSQNGYFEGSKAPIPVGPRGIDFDSVESMYRFARLVYNSGLAPQSFSNPEQITLAFAWGKELGVSPMQALMGMSVINGRVGLMNDLALALVEQSGLLEYKRAEWTGKGDELACTVTLKRKGKPAPRSYSYSIRQARGAGLFDRKSSSWISYPERMTYHRALGFLLDDEFPDVVKGMKLTEVLSDYPSTEKPVEGRVIEPAPVPTPQAEKHGPDDPPQESDVIHPIPTPEELEQSKFAPPKESPPQAPKAPEQSAGQMTTLERVRKMSDMVGMSEAQLVAVVQAMKLSSARTLAETPEAVLKLVADNFESCRNVLITIEAQAKAA